MQNIDREIIKEDLEFICEYMVELMNKHPKLAKESGDILNKIDRRIGDIGRRVEAM